MENATYINVGMIAALSAVRKTLAMYKKGMSEHEVLDMINEIDQQLGVRQTNMIIEKRA